MTRSTGRLIIGVLLLAVGALLLLQNLGVAVVVAGVIWGLLFAGVGLGLLIAGFGGRFSEWSIIVGFSLVGLGVVAALSSLSPSLGAIWGGPLFLGGIAVGFLILYVMKRQNWWALIPGGVMLTLAVVAGLSATAVGPYIGAVFFVGLALTFASVYILPNPSGRMSWALIVAGILFANGLLIILATEPVVGRYWPVVLILVGAYLLFRRLQPEVSHGAVAEPSGSPRPADSAGVQSRQQLDSTGDTRTELSESVGATEVLPAQAADDAAIQSSEAQGEERDL